MLMSKDHKKLFYKYELSLWQLLITFRKICFSNPFHIIVPLSFNSIQDSTKIAAKYKKVLILWGTLLQNEFTIDKYQKKIDSKCVSLKNYVNNATVKYCTDSQWNVCGGVYLEAEPFARCSLFFVCCSLLFAALLISFCSLLVTFCSLTMTKLRHRHFPCKFLRFW